MYLFLLKMGNVAAQFQEGQNGQGTPSLSPTPSPAGSVGSVGSQSSGYSSGELASRGATTGPTPVPCVQMPLLVYNALLKQVNNLPYIATFQDLWDQADTLVLNGNSRGKKTT